MLVLILEDRQEEREALAKGIRSRGHEVIEALDTFQGINALAATPDLAIVDIVLPGSDFYCPDGLTFIRKLRREGHKFPIIVLSETSLPSVKVIALRGGADDFLVKPYYMEELLARVEAVSRRTSTKINTRERIVLDRDNKVLRLEDAEIQLTPKEFRLFATLHSRPNMVFSRETLMQRVWGQTPDTSTRLVDNHVASLRRKIARVSPANRDLIVTVHCVGYKLNPKKFE